MDRTETIVFDFGNTLAPFNAREADGIDRDLAAFLCGRTGIEEARYIGLWRAAREEDFRRSARTGEEHDFRDRLGRVLALVGHWPDGRLAVEAEERVARSFVDRVSVPPEIRRATESLAGRYRLGLLSNYLLIDPIHEVLGRDGLAELFEAVIVSREIGFAKPDPRAFRAVIEALGARPEGVLFVGDDYKADIEGALAFGLGAAWTWAMLEREPEVPEPLPPRVRILRTPEAYRAFLSDPRPHSQPGVG